MSLGMQVEDPRVVEFDVRTDEMLVNMGPQHPSTHGVLRLVLRTDGEVVSEVTPHIGYLHRCAEKIGENLTPVQWIPYTDRMDYLAGMNMNLGTALAVEKLAGVLVPEKAMVIRVIIAELGRIASHLVGMGAYGLDLGTFSPFLYAFREREIILDLFEEVCGARLTVSYFYPGGASHDLPEMIPIPPGLAGLIGERPDRRLLWTDACRLFLDWVQPRVAEYHTLLTHNAIFVRRTARVGNLSRELAIRYGCTGPVLRGSGVDHDLRRDGEEIYARTYQGYDFRVIVPPFAEAPPATQMGDSWHRFYVRMLEIGESTKLIRQGLDRYPTAQGEHRVPPPGKKNPGEWMTFRLPKGEAYLETECPRGQMGFYFVGNNAPIPLRARARSSSFCNLSVLPEISRGCLIADVPAIAGSLDIVMGEIDR
ncbi:MAG: NADH-quinone oxidoreductase subunit D [Planctomycetes bacterium]|nr:NADH-quinone oxidoreductase subunit D [Planctomycetota bacterium]